MEPEVVLRLLQPIHSRVPERLGFNGAGGCPPVVTAHTFARPGEIRLQWSRRLPSGCCTPSRPITWSTRSFNGAGGCPPVVTGVHGAGLFRLRASMEPEVALRSLPGEDQNPGRSPRLQWSRRLPSGRYSRGSTHSMMTRLLQWSRRLPSGRYCC